VSSARDGRGLSCQYQELTRFRFTFHRVRLLSITAYRLTNELPVAQMAFRFLFAFATTPPNMGGPVPEMTPATC